MLGRIEQLALLAFSSFCILSTSSASDCPSVSLPKVEHGCFWVAIRNADTGCVTEYKSNCLVPMPNTASCPNMIPPERRVDCAYFTIHDEQGCIVDFECEPETCKNAEDPEVIDGCITFIPKRDPEGCIQSYSCIPVTPSALPNSLPISDGDPPALPVEEVSVEEVEVEPVVSLRADRIAAKSAKADPIELTIRDFDTEPVVLLDDFKPTLSKKSAKILKDAVIIPGIKPGFGAPLARPIFASRPAVAVQPVVPLRTVVPIARPAYIPRPVVPFFQCPRFFPRKPVDSKHCRWVPNRSPQGCLMGFRCIPVNLKPRIKCPRAPIKPDIGDRCNWIPVLDKNNCILKYECEPVPPEPCPPAPLPPDDHDRCKWVSIKDADDCIMDYECVPSWSFPQWLNRQHRG